VRHKDKKLTTARKYREKYSGLLE